MNSVAQELFRKIKSELGNFEDEELEEFANLVNAFADGDDDSLDDEDSDE